MTFDTSAQHASISHGVLRSGIKKRTARPVQQALWVLAPPTGLEYLFHGPTFPSPPFDVFDI